MTETTQSENSHEAVYTRRPSPQPSVPVALGARSVVWRRFQPGQVEDNAERPWVKLLWGVNGLGMVRIGDRVLPLALGDAALFFPGMRHAAWASGESEEPWEVRWCTFDGPLCSEVTRAIGLNKPGVWRAGPPPIDAFERLHAAIAQGVTPEGERLADVAAYALLVRAAGGMPKMPSDAAVEAALHVLTNRWSEPDFGVETLARLVGIHRSALSRRFHEQIGLTPSAYLANLRMRNALSLLRATTLPIYAVAQRCGYADVDYFIRLFRRVQGVTPGAFRREVSW